MPAVGTPTKPRRKKNAATPSVPTPAREVVHPSINATFFLAEEGNLITADLAKQLLGWRETQEKEEAQFVDMAGTLIACDRNLGNREFDAKVALGKAYDILNRQWADGRNVLPDDDEPMSINGQVTAVINRYNEVEDGQKTLAALVFAKQIWEGIGMLGGKQKEHWRELWPEEPTLEGLIVFGTSSNSRVRRTIDNTQTRDFQDVLYTSGYFGDRSRSERGRLTRVLAYAVRFLWQRVWGNLDSFNPCHTNSTLFALLDRHGGKTGQLVQAVTHITDEDVVPVDRNGKAIPNAKRKLSRYVPPGTASGLLYLMGCSTSNPDDYRNAEPPNETALNWEQWDRAVDFWTALAKGGANMKEVRLALPFNVSTAPTGETTEGSPAERQAVLIKAWQRWAEHKLIREEDLVLGDELYKIHKDAEGIVESRVLVVHPKIGGIDGGVPKEEEDKPGVTREPGPGELENAKRENGPQGGRRVNGDDPAEEKRIREQLENGEPPSLADQLAELKAQHPGKVLVFKRGANYGAWGDDATVFKDVLKVKVEKVQELPYAEFKAKNLAGNLLKLLQAGHQVALSEQVDGVTVVTDYEAPE